MAYDVGYLERGLTRRVENAANAIETNIEKMLAQHAAKGLLGSGATLRQFEKLALDGFSAWFDDAATFVYSVTDGHGRDEGAYLERCGDDLCTLVGDYVTKRGKNTGLNAAMIQRQTDNITILIQKKKGELLDDFINGMLGSQKMKKDPLVNVVANQHNSPGAVQQLGIGSKQTARVENYNSLIDAVDSIINSGEYQALPEDKKIEFKDVADVLKEEAAKQTPDVGKLKRWAEKLRATAQDLGMTVATGTLATLIASLLA
ncbi:MAG: hypothetical protein K2Y27_33090 [Xanthobacteraceae bacterium]|nr:hypothetical protein [Xanthobacteraceae bacterium]